MKNLLQPTESKRRSFIKKSLAGIFGLITFPAIADSFSLTDIKHNLIENGGVDVFSMVRKLLLLDKDMVYMNTGSLGPSPRMVIDKVSEAVHKLERNPVTENWGSLGKEMEAVRGKVAAFINADVDEIVLTRNTTEGLSMVGATLALKKGDEVLTTNHEHGGAEVGLDYLVERTGAKIVKVEMPMPAKSKEQVADAIKSRITKKTKVVLLSHVVTITGLRMPITEISQICREKGILFVVDGAQAPGMLDIDIKKLDVDVYATSGHKWLMGPKETGFVYINKKIQERVRPVFTFSGYASYSASSGTRNVANIIGLGEALSFHELIGKKKTEARIKELSSYCRGKLQGVEGVELISPEDDSLITALVSVRLLKGKNRDIYLAMREKNIVVKVLPKYNALRFSNHMFNTKEDINKMVEQLDILLNH